MEVVSGDCDATLCSRQQRISNQDKGPYTGRMLPKGATFEEVYWSGSFVPEFFGYVVESPQRAEGWLL